MKVLILGCGWVGEELAFQILSSGKEVWASVTSQEKLDRLTSLGVKAFMFNFDQDINVPIGLPNTFDYILTSVPAASKCSEEEIAKRFENVSDFLKSIHYSKHIYLSSVGVYPDVDGEFSEEYESHLNERLLIAEQRMSQLPHSIIYRLGGLFGKNRIFAKYFQNRVCTTGGQPSNFVHLDDVVQLVIKGFEWNLEEGIFNIVAPEHPSKEEVILASAKKYSFDEPSEFKPENSFQKIVSGSKIMKSLDYTFIHPSPLFF